VTKEVGGVLIPVYTDGKKEETYDPPSMRDKIKTQAEDLADLEKTSTQESAESKKKLRAWERLGDIKDVRAALSTVKALSDGDLDAAELPKKLADLTAERDALQEQLDDAQTQVADLDNENYSLGVGNEIANAVQDLDLIEGMTPKEVERLIDARSVFKKEGGSWVPYTPDGRPIMVVDDGNKPRHATPAEALDQLIPKTFRKPSSAAGSDAVTPQTTSTHGTVRSKTDLKGPTAKAEFIDKHGLEEFQKLPSGTPS
jgi:hypothetical protein